VNVDPLLAIAVGPLFYLFCGSKIRLEQVAVMGYKGIPIYCTAAYVSQRYD